MSKTLEPLFRTAQVAFELDSFDVIDGERCDVHGRWFAIRGRRFMRPELTVTIDGRSMRLLADLAGKPWAAEEGEPWHASFPFALTGEKLADAELTVAPDVTIALLSPRPATSEPAPTPNRAARGRAPDNVDESWSQATPSRSERLPRPDTRERVRRELVDAREQQRRLRSQIDHLRTEKADTAERIEELIVRTGEVNQELGEVREAREELAAELEADRAKLDGLAADRDAALRGLEEMTAKHDAACHDHAEAVHKLRATDAARRRTVAERDRALADWEAIKAARDATVAESDELARVNERLQSELAILITIRDDAMLARRTARSRPGRRSYAASFQRAAPAVVLLVTALLVVLIVLRP
jgi:hypothetical protein